MTFLPYNYACVNDMLFERSKLYYLVSTVVGCISQVTCISSTADGVSLVAVGNSGGLIVVVDLTKHLMLWETWSFRIDEDKINDGLTFPTQKCESDEQWDKLKQKIDQQQLEHLPEQERQKKEQKEKDEKSVTEKGETQNQGEVKGELSHHIDETEQQRRQDDQENKAVVDGDVKDVPPASSNQCAPVTSCKLHSLSIVQSVIERDSTDASNRNKDDANSSNVDPSLLIGVSFCRSSGTRDAAIIVCDILSSSTWKSVTVTTKKTKSKSSPYLATPVMEPMGDILLDIDDVMAPPLPIAMEDINLPSWELIPPIPPELSLASSNIPPPPPLPPLKNNSSAHKTEKGSQLQIFVVSEYIDNLPNDAHPLVSVIQPCGHDRVAVALEYGANHGGCIILFNLEQCAGKTILGKSVMFEFETADQQVIDMCAMENLDTGRTDNNNYCLAVVTKCGSFIVFSMQMSIIDSLSAGSDPLVSCFPCVNVGLFGVVTRSGVVKTVKITSGKPVSEVNVLAANTTENGMVEDSSIPVSPHKG